EDLRCPAGLKGPMARLSRWTPRHLAATGGPGQESRSRERPSTGEEVSMENPRPEKVAVVDEVQERLTQASAALLTEYRGLDVSALGELRRALRAAGGDYKVYKNRLVRVPGPHG